jgi:two-component system, NtrC family, response regulator AtoC
MAARCILVVDDEQLVRWSLAERLRSEHFEVVEAATAAEALERADGVDAVLLDFTLPDGDGLSVLKALHERDADVPVIMITAHKDINLVVETMKAGAFDYAPKPFDLDDICLRVERAMESTRLRRELRRLRDDASRPFTFNSMIGESEPMQKVKTLARKMASSPASTVLITGESGTGKDLLAKIIHYSSGRAARPFVNITSSALPETLLESELFGHERGAFTDARQQKRGLIEQADEGTVFLDEIGEIPPALQAKLLRVLEEKRFRRLGGTADLQVDVRIIAATNRNLEDAVRDGKFRDDLYYRLNVLRIEMPPLRVRERDIVLLAQHFVELFAKEFKRPVRGISRAAEDALLAYSWPGNVRELRNLVERGVLLAEGETLEPSDFESMRPIAHATQAVVSDGPAGVSLPVDGVNLEEVEKRLVVMALERTNGNQTRAAALLGLHRDQIRYRIEKFGLTAKKD